LIVSREALLALEGGMLQPAAGQRESNMTRTTCATIILGLLLAAPAPSLMAQGVGASRASTAAARWSVLSRSSDLAAIDRAIHAIGPRCAEDESQQSLAAGPEAPVDLLLNGPAPKLSHTRPPSGSSLPPDSGLAIENAKPLSERLEAQANGGDVSAQRALGTIYESGDGSPPNYTLAVYWLRKAADQGDAVAENQLGVMYSNGYGVARDVAEAAALYSRSAAQGDAAAQLNLGLMYEGGLGVPASATEAAKLYQAAAAQNNATAEYNLGLMYDSGRGVPQNLATAVRLWLRAAKHGNLDALNNLGAAYALGRGVSTDDVQAFKWFDLAASAFPEGDQEDRAAAVRNRDIVSARMTSLQIAQARREASLWRSSSSGAGK
jgi:TPR repeat protein